MRAVDRAGICFQGDLALRIEMKRGRYAIENAIDARRMESRRRPAAEENSLDGSLSPCSGCLVVIKLRDQRFGIYILRDYGHDVRVEVAVRAFANALRNMNVKRKGLFLSRQHRKCILSMKEG